MLLLAMPKLTHTTVAKSLCILLLITLCDITGDSKMWLTLPRGGAWEEVLQMWLTLPRGGAWEEVLLQQTIPSNHKAVLPKGSTWEGGARQNPSSPPLPTCCRRALSLRGCQQLRLHSLSSLIIHQGRLPILLWELTPSN